MNGAIECEIIIVDKGLIYVGQELNTEEHLNVQEQNEKQQLDKEKNCE